MDGVVSRPPRLAGARWALTWALALAAGGAMAQGWSDPTRPPAVLGMERDAQTATPGAPQLQSILISRNPGGRRVAVISGQTVRLGGRIGNAVLFRISQNEVVLKRGRTLETLKLSPRKAGEGDATVKP